MVTENGNKHQKNMFFSFSNFFNQSVCPVKLVDGHAA